MKTFLYFLYFVVKTDYRKLGKEMKRAHNTYHIKYLKLILDMIGSSLRYQSSLLDYFLYRFYDKSPSERETYLTTGQLHSFYTQMNDKKVRDYFRNKHKFNTIFKDFIKRDFLFIKNNSVEEFKSWISDKKSIMAKPNEGLAGRGIEKVNVEDFDNPEVLFQYLIHKKKYLLEDVIEQHPKMAELNPSSVNTVRIITVLKNHNTDILMAGFRIGMNGVVDNFAAGGIYAPIDLGCGIVYGPAVCKYCTEEYNEHPVTGSRILGFQIPLWSEVLELVDAASVVVPDVKTVGWDIAITEEGPELLEGNDNWFHGIQIPHKIGVKRLFEKYY